MTARPGVPARRRGPRREPHQVITGVHAVLAALQARRRSIERVFVDRDGRRPGLGRVLREAREAAVPVSRVPREVLRTKVGPEGARQGVGALASPLPYADAEALCRAAARKPDALLLLLDRVNDAGNLGAILRTAAAAGVDGVLLAGDGTAGLSAVASRTSAGALEQVPVARERHLPTRIRELGSLGFAPVGLTARGELRWDRLDLRGRWAIVAGGEERGMRPSVAKACESLAAIPLADGVESLNVSVAVGVALFEAVRQRSCGKPRESASNPGARPSAGPGGDARRRP